MFSIHKKDENGFEKVILKDNSANTYATILPACGAILHNFVSHRNGQALMLLKVMIQQMILKIMLKKDF